MYLMNLCLEKIFLKIYVSYEFCDYSGQIFLGKNHEQKKRNPEFGGKNRVAKSLGCSTLPAFRHHKNPGRVSTQPEFVNS